MFYTDDLASQMLTEMTGGNGSNEVNLDDVLENTDSILYTDEVSLIGNVDVPSSIVCLPLVTYMVDGFPCTRYESLAEASARIEKESHA